MHCPQRHVHVLGMWLDLRWRCGSDRGCAVAYRVLRQPGRVYSHRCARPLPRLYTQTGRDALAKWSARSRVTHPDTVRSEICWHLLILPSKFSVNLRRQPTVPFCFIGRRTSDSRVSFRSRTHSSSTNPSFPSTAFLRRLFASSCKKLPLNLCIERRVDDDFSYRNSSRLGLQLTRFS